MTNYILFENALQMLENAYLLSVIGLLAVSGIGIAAISLTEKEDIDVHHHNFFS